MNFVIQTDMSVKSVLDIGGVSEVLEQVHALENSPPLVIEKDKYHYLKIDDNTDLDWLIPRLMELPSIKAAYNKPYDDLPGF